MMRKTMLVLLCLFAGMVSAQAASTEPVINPHDAPSAEVLQQFNQGDVVVAPERAISTKRKHQILFWMGGALLILILLAAAFGIAMGIFGKDVFVWHILFAGLASTLAIAHAVVAFVWFYPE